MIGPLLCSPNGFQYILTMTDYFTKFVATRPLKTENATEVSSAIFSIYCNYGAPVRIITDNDPSFTSKVSFLRKHKEMFGMSFYIDEVRI